MSPFVDTHVLERAIAHGSHGVIRSLEERRAELAYDQLQEIEHQFQLPVSGIASSGLAWDTFTVGFDVNFFFAPYQRDSPFSVPHFTWGAVLDGEPSPPGATADPNNPDSHVGVFCHVVDWARDATIGAINGAVVAIGVTVVGGQDVGFSGYLHLTFQGYGSPNESVDTVPQLDVGQ